MQAGAGRIRIGLGITLVFVFQIGSTLATTTDSSVITDSGSALLLLGCGGASLLILRQRFSSPAHRESTAPRGTGNQPVADKETVSSRKDQSCEIPDSQS